MLQIKMKKILMFMIFGMFLVSLGLVSANPYQVNTEIDYRITCLNEGFCSSIAECVINIEAPNGTFVLTNAEMTYSTSYFNYTLTNYEVGRYHVTGYCAEGSLQNEINLYYDVTPTGEEFDTSSRNSAFIIGLGVLMLIALFLAWLAFKMEHNIVRLGMLSFSVLILIFNIGFTLNIMEDTLGSSNTFYSNFQSLYVVAIALSVALAIGLIIWLIVIALRVYKIKRGIGDGFE